MTRPLLLDLFCGAGGAAMGYHRAGFDVIGVDIAPQPRYPFEFHQADALAAVYDLVNATGPYACDAIHASPPCQHYSVTRHSHSKEHSDLVAATRLALQTTGLPWVMENVVGAPMPAAIELCGASFGLIADDTDGAPLVLRRHRLFESSALFMVPPCDCRRYRSAGYMVGGVYGGGPSNRSKAPWKGSDRRRGGYTPSQPVRAELMGIDWMTQAELCQAIPPAYTEFIGAQLLQSLHADERTPVNSVLVGVSDVAADYINERVADVADELGPLSIALNGDGDDVSHTDHHPIAGTNVKRFA